METHLLHCPTCDYTGLGLKKLRRHRKQAHQAPDKEPPRRKQCEICGAWVIYLKMHKEQVHGKKVLNCDYCEYTSISKTAMTTHEKGHFLITQKCPICERRVKYLKKHVSRCPMKNKGIKYPCDQCDKRFASSPILKTHVDRVHKKIKNHQCEFCDHKTFSRSNLRIHTSRMHSAEHWEQFCPVCQKKTIVLEKHLKTFHFDYYLEQQKEKQPEEGTP